MTSVVVKLSPADPWAELRLMAYMAWPASELARSLAMTNFGLSVLSEMDADFGQRAKRLALIHMEETAANAGLTLQNMRKLPEFETELHRAAEWLEQDLVASIGQDVLLPSGGRRALCEKPSLSETLSDLRRAAREGRYLANSMILVARMAEHHPHLEPSLNLAEHVCPPSPSIPTIIKYRKKWRCVGPLHAAYKLMVNELVNRGIDPKSNGDLFSEPPIIDAIISWSMWLTKFAMEHTANKSDTPMLPADEALIFETACKPRKPLLRPLSDTEIATAQNYRKKNY